MCQSLRGSLRETGVGVGSSEFRRVEVDAAVRRLFELRPELLIKLEDDRDQREHTNENGDGGSFRENERIPYRQSVS